MAVHRSAVVDLGSGSFRMAVFSADRADTRVPGGVWWQSSEIFERVRLGSSLDEEGNLASERIARALHVCELFDHYCSSHDLPPERIDVVATSAIREAPNRRELLDRVADRTSLPVRVLTRDEEAHYGYVAAVNTTLLHDGAVLDVGGGSLQLVGVEARRATHQRSWKLGGVRMTERFLEDEGPASPKELARLRRFAVDELQGTDWVAGLAERGHLVGIGGTVRNLATAVQHARGDVTDLGVQGVLVHRDELEDLVERLAELPAKERSSVPGIKPARQDVILAGAIVVLSVLDATGIECIETTEAGLREGVFLAEHLAFQPEPLFAEVREASVRNLAGRFDPEPAHSAHVERLALQLFDGTARCGLHDADRVERQLLRAAALLHDIGMAVDYDDHHKHGRYLVLANGLPGFSPAETAIVAQAVRYHRKGTPSVGPLAVLTGPDDEARVTRISTLLRLAEMLERGHDEEVRRVTTSCGDGALTMRLATGPAGAPVARWAVAGERGLVRKAFGVELHVEREEG